MPFRKYPYRRRGYRRRYGFRKKTSIKRYLRRKASKGLSVFKIRGVDSLLSDGFGVINTRYSTTAPDKYRNGTGTLEDWTSLLALYDSFRICAIKLKFIPHFPNNTSTTTAYAPLYVVPDWDSTTGPSTVATAIQYERMRTKNLFRPWSVYFKIPKTFKASGNQVAVGGIGWYDMANPIEVGSITLYSGGNSTSSDYGEIIATYYIACKNRR